MYHRPACVVVGQDESFLMMLSEVSAPPRRPNTSALGTRMQSPGVGVSAYRCRRIVLSDNIVVPPAGPRGCCHSVPFDRRPRSRHRGSTGQGDRSLRSTERDGQHAVITSHPREEKYARHESANAARSARRRLASSLRAVRKRERKARQVREILREAGPSTTLRERGRETETESGTLARVAGRRVTESGSRAFRRYIKTVPCVAATDGGGGGVGLRGAKRSGERYARDGGANGAVTVTSPRTS